MTAAAIEGLSKEAVKAAYQDALKAGAELTRRQIQELSGKSDRTAGNWLAEFRKLFGDPGAAPKPEPTRPSKPPKDVVVTEVPVVVAKPAEATQEAATSTSRPWAWVGFLLGIGASVAANVQQAQDQWGPRMAAAFFPVALLLCVEVLTRTDWKSVSTSGKWLSLMGIASVGMVAAVISYQHISELLVSWGWENVPAHLAPLAVDGMLASFGYNLWATKRRQK